MEFHFRGRQTEGELRPPLFLFGAEDGKSCRWTGAGAQPLGSGKWARATPIFCPEESPLVRLQAHTLFCWGLPRRLRREQWGLPPMGRHPFPSAAKEKGAKESQRHGDSCGPRRPAPAQAAWGIGKPCKIGCVYAAGIFLPRQRPAWFQIHAGLFMRAMRPVAEWRSVLSNQQGSRTRPASRGACRATAVKPRSSGMSPYTPARHRRAEAGAGL